MKNENNKLIAEFMGYKYYHPGVDIDDSDCGGIYTRKEIFSKIPIEVEEFPEVDQYYFKDIQNPDYKKENPSRWRNDIEFLEWGTINHGKYITKIDCDSSWDSLMEVVEKIESIKNSKRWPNAGDRLTHLYTVEINDKSCKIYENMWAGERMEIYIHGNTKIDAVYNSVLEFIKKYKNEEL